MTIPPAAPADRKPRLDPYEMGRALAVLLRSARSLMETSLPRPRADTSIAWEDGESDRDRAA